MLTTKVSDLTSQPLAREFEELFRAHYQLVYRTAYGITGRVEDAEDVLQTVFLRLMRRGVAPDFETNPKGYLYRAAVNISLDTLERRRRHVLTDADGFIENSATTVEEDPHEAMRKRLSNAFAKLRPRALEILILHYEHDYSDAEIAEMLGTSRGVIAVSLYRSRTRLRKLLRTQKEGSHETTRR